MQLNVVPPQQKPINMIVDFVDIIIKQPVSERVWKIGDGVRETKIKM